MEKDIVEGKLGSVGEYDLEFKEGKLKFILKAGHSGVNGVIGIEVDSDAVLDAIAKANPSQIDDAILAVIKAALKA